MRFNLELVKTPDSERILINLLSRYPRSYGNLVGVLDTGSPRTIISAKDASILKIPIDNLEKVRSISGFGRGAIPCRIIKNFKIALKSDDSHIKLVELPIHVVDISALNSMNQEFALHAYQIPSIIGIDFLKILNLSLNVNFNKDIAYLEEN
jgi:hypothetical protein